MPKIHEIERTPNPNAMRFVLKEPITTRPARSFETADQAQTDELAKELFDIENVISVYYVDKYVTVTQDGGAEWPSLLRKLAVPIREAQASTAGVQDFEDPNMSDEVKNSSDPRLILINEMLAEQVRPYLLADGGGLKVLGLDGNELKIHYQGACGTCPTATTGTLYAIESMVKRIDTELQVVNV
jgi:Fe-S cluster biogenesis protein NfuA